MMEGKKISIILPYFGGLPWLTRLFFRSCGNNSNIDFIFFTDQKIDFKLPKNVIHVPFLLKDFNHLASQKLNLSVKLKYPYKLCDYKPLYGHIFEDYLSEADFWGYSDMDMIFGRIDSFLSRPVLNTYDIITSRKDSFAGNFTLFKNNDTTKYLYREANNWKTIITHFHYVHSFPERFKEMGRPAGSGWIYRFKKLLSSQKLKASGIDDLNDIIRTRKNLQVYFGDFILSDEYLKNKNVNDWKVTMVNGKWVEQKTGKEGLYFHFYRLKDVLSKQDATLMEELDIQNTSISPKGIAIKD